MSRAAYQRRKPAVLAQIRFKLYQLTEQQYELMLEEQNGLCAICGKPETSRRNGVVRKLSVDHDHETGKVRKLLCRKHNSALGMVDEDISILMKMVEYLKEHKS